MAVDCVEEKKFTFFFFSLFYKLFIEHKKTAMLPSFFRPPLQNSVGCYCFFSRLVASNSKFPP